MAVYRKVQESQERQIKRLLEALLKTESSTVVPTYLKHKEAVEPWKRAMASGTLTGKAFSHHTVQNYARYAYEYLAKYENINTRDFRSELEQIPPENFGRRDKYFKGIVCFAKFLIREKSLEADFIDEAMEIKPKRHIPAKQVTINEEQLNRVQSVCKTPLERLIIQLLSSTGLRASEFCALKVGDLVLDEGYLTVERGKGGKRRRVGLNHQCVEMLKEHVASLSDIHPDAQLFLAVHGRPMVRDGLLNRIHRIGNRVGLKISPHVLRRAFVTINANKGRSLVMLQMACGHSDIKTTRSYCKTTEDEMINAMKDW